jgi:hypothetical protein
MLSAKVKNKQRRTTMPKYFMIWEVDSNRIPVNPKERGAAWLAMTNMIKQDLKEGTTTDWGSFVGETKGYAVSKMTEVELGKHLQRFVPYVTFEVHQVVDVDQVADLARSLSA